MTDDAPVAAVRVTTLELFFDLVFVFTVTQFTGVLAHDLDWQTLWHVVVMLSIVFWMYDGYAWLTNSVPAADPRKRVLLLVGMAGYLVIALAIPTAFDDNGLVFGLAYLPVVLVHVFLYARTPSDLSAAAIRGISPMNLVAAIVVIVGGAIGGTAQEALWTVVAFAPWLIAGVHDFGVFEIGSAHFVERHGLLVIVALGESVVAIGVGAEGLDVDGGLVYVAAVALMMCAGLWWAYFGADEADDAEAAMEAADDASRTRMALFGFGYAHAVILLGVIFAAVGIEAAIAHPGDELSAGVAFALAGGVALFLVGDVYFRFVLGLHRSRWRYGAAVAVLLAVPFGAEVSAAAGLAAVTVLLAAALVVERAAAPPRVARAG